MSSTPVTASAISSNGDLKPYGAAFVPDGFAGGGKLNPGDLLVSNFNKRPDNTQGFGTTIVRVTPAWPTSTFFQGKTPPGPPPPPPLLKPQILPPSQHPTRTPPRSP